MNSYRVALRIVLWTLTISIRPAPTQAEEPDVRSAEDLEVIDNRLNRDFTEAILPIIQQRCLRCHDAQTQEGKLDLSREQQRSDIVARHETWEIVLQRLEAEEMPPAEASPGMTPDERQQVIGWLRDVRHQEASRHAGDPGIVLARRLNNAEFDYSIRDLTQVDIRPTREFPVDPANTSGFDNSGESLTMSPALLTKYVGAARHVADHVVLTPRGLLFAPHPVITETDRDKFCVQRIVDFYERHQVNYAEYFLALWKYQHRILLNRPESELTEFAAAAGLSVRYLTVLNTTLTQSEKCGPVKELQTAWAKLPADASSLEAVQAGCEQLSQLVAEIRKDLDDPIPQLQVEGISAGSQPLVLWWNQKIADRRMAFPGDQEDSELDAARARYCQVFPNAFAVASRGHYSDGNLGAGVRLLSAGFHLMHGYFRDDRPLYELVLDDDQRAELDELWQDLNFVAMAPVRQYKDFLFFERAEPPQFAGGPEFDFARAEDKDATSVIKLLRMRQAYVKRATEIGGSAEALQAIETYFDHMSRDFRWIESTQSTAESSHLTALSELAQRAWRRPLSPVEQAEISDFYRRLRDQEGLSHEDAVRDSIASMLVSPRFCYRYPELPETKIKVSLLPQPVGSETFAVRPLTDYELASRLSYFLWSSLPDEELLGCAETGLLHHPETLTRQTKRMLQDSRARGLATEFLGNLLEFRRFEEFNSVDRARFPEFTSELRAAMYEEPIRFFLDQLQENGSLLTLLNADHTFVNRPLAKLYGMNVAELPAASEADQWVKVDQARSYGRGGLLPMAVFLTKNSPGLRTSPVKRGYWIVRRVLGEHIPAPPPNVPELPQDEAALGDLTLAELLARHRDQTACAGCHQRFDAIGLVFEGYGPIGELRTVDLSGHPVQTQATFPDGTTGQGLEDLRQYLLTQRRDDYIDNFVRRMFVYGLGRSLLLSDTATIESTKTRLAADDYRLQTLVGCLVNSPQFVNCRSQTSR